MTSPFDPRDVEVLAAALPGTADNPLGRATRGVLATHLKRCTPGHYSQMFGTGPAFRDIFFGGVQPNPHEGAIVTLTGLDDAFFASVSVAALCQQMGQCTSRLRPQITMGPIANDLNAWNSRLMTGSYRLYAYMAGVTDGPIRSALSAFPDPAAKQTAKDHYLAGLTSESWVTAKKVQEASQQWPDRDWELFHHWIKLTALGADPAEIDRAIQTIITMGLGIPAAYGPARWREQSPWFGPGLGASDAADAVGAILETRCHAYPGGGYSCMAEDNSFEFTANTQPGTRYRQLPSSSCFVAGTRVVTADGSLRPIEGIVPGELVATAHGPKRVLLRAETRRDGRTLQRFAGAGFAFSATHPFVAAPQQPGRGYYAAADPAGLARAVPMLAPFGIRALVAGETELVRHTPEGAVAWPVPGVEPAPDIRPELLYDLVVDIGEDGRSEYFAGDERTQVLVSSEMPRFGAAPDAAWVLMRILEQVTPVILEALAPVADKSFADLVNVGLTSLSRTLMPAVGPDLHRHPAQSPDAGAVEPVSPLQAARALAGALARPEGGADRRATVVFEQFVAVFAPQIQAALAMGWRSFDLAADDVANLLTVDLYDIELFQPAAPDAPASVDLALARDAVSYTRRIPVTGRPSSWYLTSDGPAYFPEWSRPEAEASCWSLARPAVSGPALLPPPWPPTPPERLLWELQIHLAPWSAASAKLPLPAGIAHGYEDFVAPLLDPDGNVVGCARGDTRLLTSEAFAAEWEARRTWKPVDQGRIAHRLAALGGRYLADGFAKAIDEFRYCAATTRTP
ncbi:hypothetical protein KGA66_04990 [Actinocrinis puniceicyclus]|uniref:Uncharacterized protein n=1 Tax=Actinocrinis puniceicyclus TaxID=977794 RepID=A0A8J7WK77_9ACTN|nr:hypothetical protein [Actinocrinis puniceicyclus]MBS2962390.1 hypothetical protein [Actinocrinis puniceicyclus]